MSTKHTPGPWSYELSNDGNNFKLTSDDKQVVDGCGCCGPPWCDKADAQLISAAPDLLEALKGALWRMEQYDYQAMQGTIENARAAIKKATGETP